MLSKRLVKKLDFTLVGVIVIIVIFSLVIIGSATHINTPSEDRYWYVQRQGIFALLNGALIFFMLHFDYKALQRYGNHLYVFNIVMLLAVMFLGHSALGAQRWIQIGPVSLQPSEFSKIIMIISLAALLENKVGKLNHFKDLLPIAAYVGLPFLLVLKQPDLGTSLVFVAIVLGMVFVAGVNLWILFWLFIMGLILLPFIWFFVLHPYQQDRILVFLDPNIDPLGAGYHIIQSKIAIGSGMLFGKGLFGGTQSQLNFLPENHTDFIFAVVGEELGFVGSVILLILYLIVLYRSVKIANESRDNFGTLLAVGVASMLTFHLLVNVGMTAGIMPVTGIPFPLMSYGVSSLTTNMIAIGVLLNIHMRRQKILF